MDHLFIALLLPTLGVLIILFVDWLNKRSTQKTIAQFEYQESIYNGAIEEPHAIRELNNEERAYLYDRHRILYWIINHPIVWIGCFILIFIMFYSEVTKNQYGGFAQQQAIFGGLFSLILTIAAFFGCQQIENKYYKDCRVAVWQVQGGITNIITDKDKYQTPIQIRFTVRNNSFAIPYKDKFISNVNKTFTIDELQNDSYRNLYRIVSNLPERTEVIVEYSPFSKKVWDIRKVVVN
jgi:hypothetical protein